MSHVDGIQPGHVSLKRDKDIDYSMTSYDFATRNLR